MKYDNVTLEKYQIMLHMVNIYAKKHEGVKPEFNYDPKTQTLEIGGISKPITFQTNTIGEVPAGEYEVVGEAVLSKNAKGKTDINGMNEYKPSIVNVANYPEVFDFIDMHRCSTSCACCGTNRERNDFFYIRRVDDVNHDMFQVGSSCVDNYFDRSYFKLMKDLYSVVNESDYSAVRGKTKDCNLIQYMATFRNERGKGRTFARSHKAAVESSNGVTDIKSEDKDAFKARMESVLNYSRANTVSDSHAPALKTVQEMMRMMNGDAGADPYYSATRCQEIAKECERLFDAASHYDYLMEIEAKKKVIADYDFTFDHNVFTHISLDNDFIKIHLTDEGIRTLGSAYSFRNDHSPALEITERVNFNEDISKIVDTINSKLDWHKEYYDKIILRERIRKETYDVESAAREAIRDVTSGLNDCDGIRNTNYVMGDDGHVKTISFKVDRIGKLDIDMSMSNDEIRKYVNDEIPPRYNEYIRNRNIERCEAIGHDFIIKRPISVSSVNCETIEDATRVEFTLTDKDSQRTKTGSFKVPNYDWSEKGVSSYIRNKFTESCEKYERELNPQVSENRKLISRIGKKAITELHDIYPGIQYNGEVVHDTSTEFNVEFHSCGQTMQAPIVVRHSMPFKQMESYIKNNLKHRYSDYSKDMRQKLCEDVANGIDAKTNNAVTRLMDSGLTLEKSNNQVFIGSSLGYNRLGFRFDKDHQPVQRDGCFIGIMKMKDGTHKNAFTVDDIERYVNTITKSRTSNIPTKVDEDYTSIDDSKNKNNPDTPF